MLLSWAMNTAATHWKMAAPSMFTVAPMGRMNLLILLSTPLFSSMHLIIEGRVAELEMGKPPPMRAILPGQANTLLRLGNRAVSTTLVSGVLALK